MDEEKIYEEVADFFVTNQTPITAEISFHGASRNRESWLRFDFRQLRSDGSSIRIPCFGINVHNLGIDAHKVEQSVIDSMPLRLHITPDATEPETGGGANRVSAEWYIPCKVPIEGPFSQHETIQKIRQGLRVEHFFIDNDVAMARWRGLLTKIATSEAVDFVNHSLRTLR